MAEEPIQKELDALKADIAQLRKDISGLTTAVKEVASEKVSRKKEDAQQRVQGAWEDVERKLDEILNQGQATVGDIESRITQHPAGSMLTAFGLGFIIAKLMDVGGKH